MTAGNFFRVRKFMKYIRSRKIYAAAAFVLAFSMLASSCSKNDSEGGEVTSVSINVIGGDSGSADGNGAAEGTTATTVETEIVTDEAGETVTGVNGEALTQPVNTEIDPAQTISDDEILNAMTGTTAPPQVNIDRYSGTRYAYDTLNADEKKLYDAILSGVESLRYKICDEDAYTTEQWAKIYGMVYNQEPQLFYMSGKIKVGKLFYLTKDTEVINQMQQSIDATVNKILSDASGKATTFEKLLVFHDYLVLNSTFELKGASSDYNSSIYNAFGSGSEQGNIQCAGYAKAMQYLCNKAGITCMVVTGETTSGESHAWNVVNVDGAWYNLDATWDDPILSTPNYKNLRHKYFLIPDSWIHNITHMHVNEKKLSSGKYYSYFTPPACTSTASNYFIKNGLVCSDFASADKAIRAEIKKAAEQKSRAAHIMVASKEVYDAVYDVRFDYNAYAKELGVKGVADECSPEMLIIEFDVLYN